MLETYLRNSGWINTFVAAHGSLLLLSWQKLAHISDSWIEQSLEQARVTKHRSKRRIVVHLSDFHLSWESAGKSSKFPFIAKQTGILIHRSTPENARALISERDLIQRCTPRLGALGLSLEIEE